MAYNGNESAKSQHFQIVTSWTWKRTRGEPDPKSGGWRGVSGSKEIDLFILTAQRKADELGRGRRRTIQPQGGALSKARALKSASRRARPGSRKPLLGDPGPRRTWRPPRRLGPDHMEPARRASVRCPSDPAAPSLVALRTGHARG